MKTADILDLLEKKQIELTIEGDRLKYKAPKESFSSELLSLLKTYKTEIIDELNARGSDTAKHFPLSYNQQSLWFVHQLDKESAAYNVVIAFTVHNGIDTAALANTIEQLVELYPILRTTYRLDENRFYPVQEIHSAINTSVNLVDGSSWNENEINNRLKKLYKKPFDLENGPVFRIHSIKLVDGKHILLFMFHHIVCDGWSLKLFFDNFAKLYESQVSGDDNHVAKPRASYNDYVTNQQKLLQSTDGERLYHYWEKQLHGFPQRLTLPYDFEKPEVQRYNGSSLFFDIKGELYNKLKLLAKTNKATLYSLLLSAFQILLMIKSSQSKILVGTIASGRKNREFHNQFGYFINPIVIPGKFEGSKPYCKYFDKIKKVIFKSLDFQDYPFPLLVEKLADDRAADKSPVFQVLFNMLHTKQLGSAANLLYPITQNERHDFGALQISPILLQQQEGQYDLTLEIIDTEKKLFSNLKYNTFLFQKETAETYVHSYLKLLETITTTLDVTLGELSTTIDPTGTLNKAEDSLSLVLASTFTIDLIEPGINFWLKKIGLPTDLLFAPYNQIFQQLLDPSSLISNNSSGINVIFIRLDDWIKNKEDSSISAVRQNAIEFTNALETSAKNTSSTYVIFFCPSSPTLFADPKTKFQLSEIENEICSDLNEINGVFTIPSDELLSLYPVADYYEPMGEHIGHIPYTQDFFDAASTLLARKIYCIVSKPYKVIVLDCDNTLWDGVVGEDGVLDVKVSPLKKELQEFIISQYQSGMVICLCSKNNEADIENVLDQHPDMVLRETHIAARKINWLPKSQNIIELSRELNLGLDSFIFIDDNPIECAEVQAACPEVLVIQLPEKGKNLESLLTHIWAFDHLKVTGEDAKRSEFYRADHQRKSCLQEAASFADFINSLNLEISISDIKQSTISRVSQLTQRTNQFNMTTIRRSESEILRLSQTGNHHISTVHVSDRFGDYGLVGVIIVKSEADTLKVDSFILSCRALGKGVEHKMAAHLGHLADAWNLNHIEFPYLPTERNTPAKKFLDATVNDYVKNKNGGWTYRFPTTVATAIRFQPDGFDFAPENEKKEIKEETTVSECATLRVESRGKILLDIAMDFSDIATLSKFIHPIKKGPSPGEISDSAAQAEFEDVASHSRTESRITEIWQNVLKIKRIHPDDKFFEIGGKSVLIPQIVIQLKKKHDLDIRIVDVFQYPTIRSLSAFIDRQGKSLPENKGQQSVASNTLLKNRQRALKVRSMLQRKRQ